MAIFSFLVLALVCVLLVPFSGNGFKIWKSKSCNVWDEELIFGLKILSLRRIRMDEIVEVGTLALLWGMNK